MVFDSQGIYIYYYILLYIIMEKNKRPPTSKASGQPVSMNGVVREHRRETLCVQPQDSMPCLIDYPTRLG